VEWIAWWTLYTVAIRVIMVWLFNQTGGSVFGMILFHMTINVTWLLYPVGNSFFDPRVTGLILAAIAASVVLVWGRECKNDVGNVGRGTAGGYNHGKVVGSRVMASIGLPQLEQ
jgi:hypothetical protein